MIRKDGTLLDGLSTGEKLNTAFKIALQRMGELKLMCLDGFDDLDESVQKQVIDICEKYDIQAFMTITKFTGKEQFTIENTFGEDE